MEVEEQDESREREQRQQKQLEKRAQKRRKSSLILYLSVTFAFWLHDWQASRKLIFSDCNANAF